MPFIMDGLDTEDYDREYSDTDLLKRIGGYFRPHNRDEGIENLYLVGAGTHPGAGVSAVIQGAKVTAGLMLKDLEKAR